MVGAGPIGWMPRAAGEDLFTPPVVTVPDKAGIEMAVSSDRSHFTVPEE